MYQRLGFLRGSLSAWSCPLTLFKLRWTHEFHVTDDKTDAELDQTSSYVMSMEVRDGVQL